LGGFKDFAEDMRGRPADDKQKPIGVLIRKQFIVFPVETPLSQILANCTACVVANKSCATRIWVKQLGTIAQISFGAWPL